MTGRWQVPGLRKGKEGKEAGEAKGPEADTLDLGLYPEDQRRDLSREGAGQVYSLATLLWNPVKTGLW